MIRNEIEVSKESKRGRRFLGWSNNRVDVQNLMRCFFLVAVAVVEVAGLLEAFCFLDVIKGNTSCSVNCGAGGAIFCGQKIKKCMRPPMLPRKRMMKTTTLLVRCSYMRKMIELSTQILEIQEELKEMKERQQEQDD